MLELKKLRIRGVGRFLEEQVIDFERLGKFVQCDGMNNNTGGSSGAGKSTIFQALCYLFGISNIPGTVLKCRYSDDAMYVQGEFLHDGKPLTITRHKKLHIDYHDGRVITGSAAVTEEELDKIIAIPRLLFRPMMHKRQKEGGFFLNMTPKDLMVFLMNCLGLGHYVDKLAITDKRILSLEESKKGLQGLLDSSNAALKATEDAIGSLGQAPVREIDQAKVVELKAKADKSSGELAFWTTVQKKDLESLEAQRPKVSQAPFSRHDILKLEESYNRVESSINLLETKEFTRQNNAKIACVEAKSAVTACYNAMSAGTVALEKAKEVAEQLEKMKVGKCYVCESDWQDLNRQEILKKSIPALRETIEKGKKAKLELEGLSAKAADLEKEIQPKEIIELPSLKAQKATIVADLLAERKKEENHLTSENVKAREEQSKFAALQSALRARHEAESGQLMGQADIDRRAFDAAAGSLKAYIVAAAKYEENVTAMASRKLVHQEKVKEHSGKIKEVNDELEMAEELRRGIKSYLSCSFDDALETIGEMATKIVRHSPNMANATVQFQGTKETKDGKVKEEVTAYIHMDGEENVPLLSLCGGEGTAAELAIDLAVIDLIEDRANKGIDIFILDEPFTGLDPICIEPMLEVLKNSNTKKRIIIVDHNPEVKQMVESRLTAIRDGATSRIAQN